MDIDELINNKRWHKGYEKEKVSDFIKKDSAPDYTELHKLYAPIVDNILMDYGLSDGYALYQEDGHDYMTFRASDCGQACDKYQSEQDGDFIIIQLDAVNKECGSAGYGTSGMSNARYSDKPKKSKTEKSIGSYELEQLKNEIKSIVTSAPDMRINENELIMKLSQRFGNYTESEFQYAIDSLVSAPWRADSWNIYYDGNYLFASTEFIKSKTEKYYDLAEGQIYDVDGGRYEINRIKDGRWVYFNLDSMGTKTSDVMSLDDMLVELNTHHAVLKSKTKKGNEVSVGTILTNDMGKTIEIVSIDNPPSDVEQSDDNFQVTYRFEDGTSKCVSWSNLNAMLTDNDYHIVDRTN